MAVESGYLGQDIQLRKGNQDGTTVPVERGHLGGDIWDRTTRTVQLGQDSRTGQLDRTVLTGRPHRQPGQVSLERTEITGLPGHDSGVSSAVANSAWAGQLEQEDS
jgi:hypothetical protein